MFRNLRCLRCRYKLTTLQSSGCIYLISMYYQRYELQWRLSLFFSASILAGGFGGVSFDFSSLGFNDSMLIRRSFSPMLLQRWMVLADTQAGDGIIFFYNSFLKDAEVSTQDLHYRRHLDRPCWLRCQILGLRLARNSKVSHRRRTSALDHTAADRFWRSSDEQIGQSCEYVSPFLFLSAIAFSRTDES